MKKIIPILFFCTLLFGCKKELKLSDTNLLYCPDGVYYGTVTIHTIDIDVNKYGPTGPLPIPDTTVVISDTVFYRTDSTVHFENGKYLIRGCYFLSSTSYDPCIIEIEGDKCDFYNKTFSTNTTSPSSGHASGGSRSYTKKNDSLIVIETSYDHSYNPNDPYYFSNTTRSTFRGKLN